jgi:hypothetical protein
VKIDSYNGISDIAINELHLTSEGKEYSLNHPTELIVDMRYKGQKLSNSNSQGWERSGKYFFKELLEKHPEFFNKSNTARIKAGDAPIVNEHFLKFFPQYKAYLNETLVHHHIGGDGQAVAVPESMHRGYGEIHIPERELGIRDNAKRFSDKCATITEVNPEMMGKTAGDFKDYIRNETIVLDEVMNRVTEKQGTKHESFTSSHAMGLRRFKEGGTEMSDVSSGNEYYIEPKRYASAIDNGVIKYDENNVPKIFTEGKSLAPTKSEIRAEKFGEKKEERGAAIVKNEKAKPMKEQISSNEHAKPKHHDGIAKNFENNRRLTNAKDDWAYDANRNLDRKPIQRNEERRIQNVQRQHMKQVRSR